MKNKLFNIIAYINLILCIIVLVLLYKSRSENFITWFQQNEKSAENNNKSTTYTCRRHYIKQDIIIGMYNYREHDQYSQKFTSKLIDILLKQSNIANIKMKKFNTDSIIYDKLLTSNIDIALVSSLVIYEKLIEYKKYESDKYDNIKYDLNVNQINFITCMNTLFLYIIVTKSSNITSINDITNKKIIGVDKMTSSWLCAKHIFNFMGFQEDIDYVFKFDSYRNNSVKITNNKIDCLIQTDIYPSKHISLLFKNNFENTLRLLPLDEIDAVKFTSKYVMYKPGYINLHKIAENYTPKIVGDHPYTTFKPMLTTYVFNNYLLGSHKIDNEVGLSIIQTIFNNINTFNLLPSMITTPIDKYNLVHDFLQIPLNKGVIGYYYDKGYITDYENINCKYLVGKKKCTKENLDKVISMDFAL